VTIEKLEKNIKKQDAIINKLERISAGQIKTKGNK